MLTKEQKDKYLKTLSRAFCSMCFDSDDIEAMHEIMHFIMRQPETISKEQFSKVFKVEKIFEVDDFPVEKYSTIRYRLVTELKKDVIVAPYMDKDKLEEYIEEYLNMEFLKTLNEELEDDNNE